MIYHSIPHAPLGLATQLLLENMSPIRPQLGQVLQVQELASAEGLFSQGVVN